MNFPNCASRTRIRRRRKGHGTILPTQASLHRNHGLRRHDRAGCIRALARGGIKVPEQCSIIGFDDVAPAAFSTPALTTIRQPMEAMGATAVEIVVDSIRAAVERRESNAVVHRKVAPELVVTGIHPAATLKSQNATARCHAIFTFRLTSAIKAV